MTGESKSIRAGGVTLHVREWGPAGAPPLVMLHGLGMSSELWPHQVGALSREHRMIAVDLRGFGRSEKPTAAGAYAVERFADDVVSLVNELRLPKLHLLGTSMGGFIAETVALRVPERLLSLILCHTGFRMSIPADILEARVAALRSEPMEAYGQMVASQALAPGAPAELRDWLVELLARNDREAYTRVLVEGLRAFDLESRVGEIRLPTLVVIGELDRVIPAAEGRLLAARIPGAEQVVIEGVGHLGYAERPEAFNDALLGFLKRVHGRSA